MEVTITETHRFEFELTRKTGKNNTLAKGNQILNSNDRMHHYVKSQITAYLRELAHSVVIDETGLLWEPIYTKQTPCKVLVTVCPPSKRRMDPPNFYPTIKAILDGMTDAHVWDDDDSSTIKLLSFCRGETTTNKQYNIIIEVTRYDE